MKYINSILKNTLLDFKKNKVRTFLTSLGISIGVMAVVLLIALGLGLKNYLAGQFENIGANIVVIFPGEGITGGPASFITQIRFDERDVRALEKISSIDYVVPAVITNARVSSKTDNKIASVFGISEDYDDIFSLEILEGEYFDKSDVAASAKVGVLAENLATDLYGVPENAVGETVKVRNMRIKIIGVVKNVGIPERDNSLQIPYTTTFGTINPRKEFFAIYTGIKNEDLVSRAKVEIEEAFLKSYEDDEFAIIEASEILESLSQIFNVVNGILVALGSISLLVGGIGIMNIMYANVTERTKEIGIKRAIGATRQDILFQFLAESTLLSLLGGIIGILLSAIIVLIMRQFFPAEINLAAVLIALGVSSFIGIFFGVFPARRAANLTPIEAIRYE